MTVVEDFAVGQRARPGPRQVDDDVVAAWGGAGVGGAGGGGAGPSQHVLGLQLRAALLADAGAPLAHLADAATVGWRVHHSLAAGDVVSLDAAVTRCRRDRDASSGVVHLHTRLLDADQRVLQEGASVSTPPVDPQRRPPAAGRDFASPAWGEELARRLPANAAFTAATAAFDGSIELAAGSDSVQLRIYRGQILAAGRSTPAGPTFTLAGEERAWLELAEAERNDYIRHAMLGRFRATGNTHEYLRHTKAVVALWDSIRDMAGLHPPAPPSREEPAPAAAAPAAPGPQATDSHPPHPQATDSHAPGPEAAR